MGSELVEAKELVEFMTGRARYLRNRGFIKTPEALELAAARIRTLEAALKWYGEQARLAQLIHGEGNAGRHAIQADGGAKARQAIGGEHG